MNVLVTGGLGLIGHNVVRRLQAQGHTVSIIDTKTNYDIIPQEEIDYLIAQRSQGLDLTKYYCLDIVNKWTMESCFSVDKPEIVIHMASFPRQKVVNAHPGRGSRTMSEGLLNLLDHSCKGQDKFWKMNRFNQAIILWNAG